MSPAGAAFMRSDLRYFMVITLLAVWLTMTFFSASHVCAESTVNTYSGSANCDNTASNPCSLCTNETSQFQNSGNVLGGYMINQMFLIINQILQKVQSTFYSGIIASTTFQQAINVAFLLYIAVYGVLITFNLASYRSGEMMNRLIKLAIVYALTTSSGWTFFSTWIENPIVGEMNQLITTMANTASGSGGRCASVGQFSGSTISTSGNGSGALIDVQLSTGPMAMLYGPMSCVFASQFISSILALFTSASFGWLLALACLWGLVEFSKMVLGAIVTYVKAIVGLTVLFGIAPIFAAFYLFEKTRGMTMAWLSMVFGFALQPVMLFAFLAFYATIIGGALTNMLSDASGNPVDVCYVPWYTMPNMFDIYWQRFKNSSGAAGGMFITDSGASGADTQLPIQVLNVLYFVVLCNLGKNFCEYINELSTTITGGTGGGVVTGDNVGSWFQSNVAKPISGEMKSVMSGITNKAGGGGTPTPRAPSRGKAGGQV